MRLRLRIIGTNNTTPGAATAPSTMLTDTSTTTGLTIVQASGAPSAQVPFRVVNADGSTVAEVLNGLDLAGYGIRLGASTGVFRSPAQLNGTTNPPCLQLPDGTAAGVQVWSGTGAPSSTTVGTGAVGDLYLRRDTPTTANQRIYACTVAGTPGTWTGVA